MLEEQFVFVSFSLGIYYALGGIGIGLGFLATSQFLKVYTYIKKPVWLTPNYSEWVGAWWLVYALGTCISLILCLFLCLFDVGRRRQHGTSQHDIQLRTHPTYPIMSTSEVNTDETRQRNTRVFSPSNPTENQSMIDDKDFSPTVKIATNCSTLSTFVRLKEFLYDIFSLIKHLLLNLRFMGITCCAIVEALLIKGYLAFLSKHIEYQFRTTASHSSVYIGVISLFSVRRYFFSFGSNELVSFF